MFDYADQLLFYDAVAQGIRAIHPLVEAYSSSENKNAAHVILAYERRAAEEKKQTLITTHEAMRDSLTGLPDRRILQITYDGLRQEFHRRQNDSVEHKPGSVLFIDLDHFKPINDSHGHNVGDMVLQVVAKRMLESVRERDVVARLGGDEFIIILPRSTSSEGVLVAQKVRQRIAEPIAIGTEAGISATIDASIGVAELDLSKSDVYENVAEADRALYYVKRHGRGGVFDGASLPEE